MKKRLVLLLCLVASVAQAQFTPPRGSGTLPDPTGHEDEFLTTDGIEYFLQAIPGGGDALKADPLSQFAATTSAQLKGVLSDENAPDGASSKLIMALGSLSIASGKTATVSNTLTLAGTDSTTMTFPSTSATIARTDAANTFTGHQTIEGVTSTGATGTGALMFGTAPQASTIELGAASDTTISRSSAGVLAVEGVTLSLNSTSVVHTAGTLELGAASDTTLARSGAGAVTVEGVQVLLSGAAGGTPSSITLTNGTALPVAGITDSTSEALGVGSLELGHASDTTIERDSAGVVTVEGETVMLGANNLSEVDDPPTALANIGGVSADSLGDVSTLDLVDLAHLDFTDVDIATTLVSSTYTLVPGTNYYGVVTGSKTFAFSPSMTVANAPTTLHIQVTGAGTWTVPTLIREGASGSTFSIVVGSTGYFTASFFKTGAGNIRLVDTIPQQLTSADVDTSVINDTAYDASSWNGDADTAPSKNAVRDQFNLMLTTGAPVLWVAMSDESTAITTGTAKVTVRAPYAFTVTAVRASLNTVSSSGIPTVDINEGTSGGTTILSTKLTIDASELTSTTAAAAAVISDTAIADDAEITFDIDVAGTGAKGLKVCVYGYR